MESFNLIYSENHKLVLNFILMKIGDISMAEELTNDVFMKVHKHLKRFDENKASMRTWIINITKNTVIDYYRKKKMNTISIDDTYSFNNLDNNNNKANQTYLNMVTNSNPHKEMVTSESIDLIKESLLYLNKNTRKVAELYFLKELTYNEICNTLNISLGNVKSTIFRARKILIKKLETQKL